MSRRSKRLCVETKTKPEQETSSWSSGTLGDDILRMYRENGFCDVKLITNGKTFPAHRFILGARSTVFRAMLEKKTMSESRTGEVNIEDVESDTLERLLDFLYKDSVGDLQFEEAVALYYAADKYAVELLMAKCSDILKTGLSESNVCDVLIFADKHSNEELLESAKNFLFEHDQVISSPAWERLEESHPWFTTKIMKEMYIKKQKCTLKHVNPPGPAKVDPVKNKVEPLFRTSVSVRVNGGGSSSDTSDVDTVPYHNRPNLTYSSDSSDSSDSSY